MKMFKMCSLALAVAIMASPAYAQELLTNGAFDTFTHVNGNNDPGSGPITMDTSTAPGWTLGVNSPDGTDLAAQYQSGFANANNTGAGGTQTPGTGAGVWVRAFEGDQGNSGQDLAQMSLSQSVLAPSAGSYLLEFVAGRETDMMASAFDVSLSSSGTGGSASVDLLTASIPNGNLGGSASGNKGGTPFSILLSGVTSGDSLTVLGRLVDGEDNVGGGGQSGFLDNFSLRAVPEPSSIAMASVGLVGLLARRRKR